MFFIAPKDLGLGSPPGSCSPSSRSGSPDLDPGAFRFSLSVAWDRFEAGAKEICFKFLHFQALDELRPERPRREKSHPVAQWIALLFSQLCFGEGVPLNSTNQESRPQICRLGRRGLGVVEGDHIGNFQFSWWLPAIRILSFLAC